MQPRLLGLEKSNLSFKKRGEGGWGKNKFNNAFPISLLVYMHSRGFTLPYNKLVDGDCRFASDCRISVPDILGEDPSHCFYEFEGIFPEFHSYVDGKPNKSDVIVYRGTADGAARRALEIKLTVVPDRSTFRKPRDKQASEFVTRPLMVELLATNICAAYGRAERRAELNAILVEALDGPTHWHWNIESEIFPRLDSIREALEAVLRDPGVKQKPMVVQPIWRTIGDSAELDENCFDAFVWSDFALALLYVEALTRQSSITRVARSVIWLVQMLWDFSCEGKLRMSEVKNNVYRRQGDKAGAFAGTMMLKYMEGPELLNPRVSRDELPNIILGGGEDYLNPERRLDASVKAQTKLENQGP